MAVKPVNQPIVPPSWTGRRVVQATLMVVALLVGLWLLYANRIALFSLFVAIVLSTAISPAFPAHWDPKLRIPRGQVVAAASIVSPKY